MLNFPIALLLAAQVSAPSPTAGSAPAPWTKGPIVKMQTSAGDLVIGLDREKAPLTVANFLSYVHGGFYDGTIFHRVIPSFMIQGGGYDEQLQQLPTRKPVRNESKNGLSNRRGTIAMARTSDPHSATAQFFINQKDNLQLDGSESRWGYTVFGEVLSGLDVVDRIAAAPTRSRGPMFANLPVETVVVRRVRDQASAKPAAAAPAKRVSPSPARGKTQAAPRTPAR